MAKITIPYDLSNDDDAKHVSFEKLPKKKKLNKPKETSKFKYQLGSQEE